MLYDEPLFEECIEVLNDEILHQCCEDEIDKVFTEVLTDEKYCVLWASYGMPMIITSPQEIYKNLWDILAVSSEYTLILSMSKKLIIENKYTAEKRDFVFFYHEGEIKTGVIIGKKELDMNLSKKIDSLCEKANILNKAIRIYKEALNLLPDKVYEWIEGMKIYSELGNIFYMMKDYEKSLECLFEAKKCLDGEDNAFINLKIGECYFELGNVGKTKNYLFKAYKSKGNEIFKGEDEKYLVLVKKIISDNRVNKARNKR